MIATTPRSQHRGLHVWQILVCLAALCLFSRLVIPVGYMPDTSGKADGRFALAVCLPGDGTSTVMVDWVADSAQPAPGDSITHQECPYGIVLAKAMLPAHTAPTLVVAAITHRPAPVAHRNQAYPPLPAVGPPLGSRAPPVNLG